jgi:hypothetical protein
MFNENFLAETKGRGISEIEYGGCIGTYNGDKEEEEHASESDHWSLKNARYGLSAPDMIPKCKSTTHIHCNYAVFHPETKLVVIVGPDRIKRWTGGKLLKECQRYKKDYSDKSEFCRACQPIERCRIRVVLVEVTERGASKISFGQRHRGSSFADVYDTDKGYVDWMLRQNAVEPAAPFADYCRDRRAAEEITMNYGNTRSDMSAGPIDLRDRPIGYIIPNEYM